MPAQQGGVVDSWCPCSRNCRLEASPRLRSPGADRPPDGHPSARSYLPCRCGDARGGRRNTPVSGRRHGNPSWLSPVRYAVGKDCYSDGLKSLLCSQELSGGP